MDFTTLVKKARSIRRFDATTPISVEQLHALVETVRVAPSGGNLQPLRYKVVHGTACELIFPHLRWAGYLKDWSGPTLAERPTGYIVIASSAAQDAPQTDIGIAGQTLQLAATAMGFGACMLGAIDHQAIHMALSLPTQLAVRLVIALGVPAETVALDQATNGIEYFRDAQGAHHVPKRSLDEVLIK